MGERGPACLEVSVPSPELAPNPGVIHASHRPGADGAPETRREGTKHLGLAPRFLLCAPIPPAAALNLREPRACPRDMNIRPPPPYA